MTGSNSFWLANPSTGFYPESVNQSLRFNKPDTPYLERTFVTPSSTRKVIIATWIKPSILGSTTPIMYSAPTSLTTSYFLMGFAAASYIDSNDSFKIFTVEGNSSKIALRTDTRFRDTNAWMHVCVAIDTDQGTSTDRVMIFFNGKRYTGSYDTYNTFPSENHDFTVMNSAIKHRIGAVSNGLHANYGNLNGYLSEFYFIDGQSMFSDNSATVNSNFLNSDADTLQVFCEQKNGVAVPKAYSGTFGNNGCRLTFEATGTGTTAESTNNAANMTNIGDDKSGQGHNFSVNALVGTDVVKDSPTNNFATNNLLEVAHSYESTLSEGNLGTTPSTGSAWNTRVSTFNVSSGKWYAEFTRVSDALGVFVGILQTGSRDTLYVGYGSEGYGYYIENGNVQNSASFVTNGAFGTTSGKLDVVGVALNLDDNELRFYKNGSVLGSAAISITAASYGFAVSQTQSGNLVIANYGQDSSFAGYKSSGSDNATDDNGQGDFYDAPPSGFLAMCSANLPDTTLSPNQDEQASDHFAVTQYEGNGLTRDIVVGFKPDWLWFKNLDNTYNHVSYDSVRGATKRLEISVEVTEATVTNAVTDFTATGGGFSLGGDGATNQDNYTIVNFAWKAGGDTADVSGNFIKDGVAFTPTQGTMDANIMSVNTTAGFAIVEFTSNVTSDVGETGTPTTVAHGLGVKPAWVIIKDRDGGSYPHWNVWHQGYQPDATYLNYQLFLSLNNASNNAGWTRTDTGFTTNLFSTPRYQYTENGKSYIAYVFAEVEGFSKFGSYQGNGLADGTFVYTGFRPKWIMFKRADSADNWTIHDTVRDPFNPLENYIYADVYNTQTTFSTAKVDYLSNGFKWRGEVNYGNNSSGTYVYMAFAEQPFKFSNGK